MSNWFELLTLSENKNSEWLYFCRYPVCFSLWSSIQYVCEDDIMISFPILFQLWLVITCVKITHFFADFSFERLNFFINLSFYLIYVNLFISFTFFIYFFAFIYLFFLLFACFVPRQAIAAFWNIDNYDRSKADFTGNMSWQRSISLSPSFSHSFTPYILRYL